jgi:hypothetical protein
VIAANSQNVGEAAGRVAVVSSAATGVAGCGNRMSTAAIAAIAQAEARLIGNPDHAPAATNGPAISGPVASPSPISVCAATIAVWPGAEKAGPDRR